MQLLPSELKHHIIEQSSDSPSSLAALALTHTSYRSEAEKALYHTLSIHASRNNSMKCMETLATNSEKAALVHFLIIDYAQNNISKNQRLTTYLSQSLINMHSLSDLRIRSRPIEVRPDGVKAEMIESLGRILCQGHFRLHALYCHDVLDISEIIKSQTDLQILGIYFGGLRDVLRILKELHDAQINLPIVHMLDRVRFSSDPDHIRIFPAFYSVDRRATIPQVLAQSFRKDEGDHMVTTAETINQLSIYLINSSEVPSVYAFAKDMAEIFPRINHLNLSFEHRSTVPRENNVKGLSVFPKLHMINLCTWPASDPNAPIYREESIEE